MVLNDFKLSKYRKTIGHEGEAFMATLQYKGKPVAEYVDYADGGPVQMTLSKDGWGQEPLLETMHAINKALEIEFLNAQDPESCAEFLCQILDEGRDFDSLYKKLAKKWPDHHIGVYWVGTTWTATAYDMENYELGRATAVAFKSPSDAPNGAEEELEKLIQVSHQMDEFKKLAGYLVIEPGTKAPLELSTEAYIQAYQKGAALQQTFGDGGSPAMSTGPTQG